MMSKEQDEKLMREQAHKDRKKTFDASGFDYKIEVDGFSVTRRSRFKETGVYTIRHYEVDTMQIRSWRA